MHDVGALHYYTILSMANRLIGLIFTSAEESRGHLHSASSPWLDAGTIQVRAMYRTLSTDACLVQDPFGAKIILGRG
jgi:hypothetical protein